MLYEGQNLIVKLVNAEQLRWQPGTFDVKPRQVCALAFRLQGTADMRCAGKHYFIDAGDVLYMPQGLGYQVEYSQTDMYAFHFVTEHCDPEPEIYKLQNPNTVRQLMCQAAQIWRGKKPGYENYCIGILYQVLGELCAQSTEETVPVYFQKAVSYIHSHFADNLTVAQLCRIAGISPTAFRQLFRTYYGTTPTEYIRSLRLEYAKNLIAGGSSVEFAARACGIPDTKYFARLVRKKYDCTPRQLRLYGK